MSDYANEIAAEADLEPDGERFRRALLAGAEMERARFRWTRKGEGEDRQGLVKADFGEAFLSTVSRWLMWAGPRGVRWRITEDHHLDATRADGTAVRYAFGEQFDPELKVVGLAHFEAGLDVMLRARDAADAERRHASGEDAWARALGVA